MAVTLRDPGSSATFGLELWPYTSGADVSSSSAVVFDGAPRSILLDCVGDGTADIRSNTSILANAGGRVVFRLYVTELPALSDAYLGRGIAAAATTEYFTIRMDTAGHIGIGYPGSTTYGSTVVSAGTWVRIAVAWTWTSTTVNQLRLWVNGTLDVTLSNVTTGAWALSRLSLVKYSMPTTLKAYHACIYVDDSTALTDPGDVRVTAKRPTSNGTAVEFTTQIGTGGSGYGSGHTPQVNERALSATNGWSISTTTRMTEEYNIEAASVGDANVTGATILDVMGWVWANVDSTANSPVHRLILQGTTYAITLTTAAALYTAVGAASYPAGSGTDIGIDAQYTTTAHLTRLFECGVMISYIPSAGGLSIPVAMHHYRQQEIA